MFIGWLLGIATGLLGIVVAGDYWEYRTARTQGEIETLINREGWELSFASREANLVILRRPRFRLLR